MANCNICEYKKGCKLTSKFIALHHKCEGFKEKGHFYTNNYKEYKGVNYA